eukprot:1190504-Prorocentrum_minimum.AAC.4
MDSRLTSQPLPPHGQLLDPQVRPITGDYGDPCPPATLGGDSMPQLPPHKLNAGAGTAELAFGSRFPKAGGPQSRGPSRRGRDGSGGRPARDTAGAGGGREGPASGRSSGREASGKGGAPNSLPAAGPAPMRIHSANAALQLQGSQLQGSLMEIGVTGAGASASASATVASSVPGSPKQPRPKHSSAKAKVPAHPKLVPTRAAPGA